MGFLYKSALNPLKCWNQIIGFLLPSASRHTFEHPANSFPVLLVVANTHENESDI